MPRLATLLAVLILSSFAVLGGAPRERAPAVDLLAPAAEGEVVVQLREPFMALDDATLSRDLGGEVFARLPEIDALRLRLNGGESPASAVARLQQLPQVRLAEPNHLLWSDRLPNDPFFSAQSGYMELIEAPEAWDIERGDSDVLVAVLDSGIDITHPDLIGKYWVNEGEIENNQVDDDGNGCVDDRYGCSFVTPANADPSCGAPLGGNIRDDNGHGTFVSGIIAATADNNLGLSGAAPGVTVVPVKILDCLGGGTAAEAAQGILYAARIGVRVANISFGADGESVTLANAMREANQRYGMVIVAATGNDGHNTVGFPARLPQAIAVGSSGTPGNADVRSPFSDWGPSVSVVAPGLNIVSTVPPAFCDKGWVCVEGQPYAVASGTSFAAPLVTGLAALLVSHTPNLPPDTVRDLIERNAQKLPDAGTPGWSGAGRIRMRQSLEQPRYFLGAPGTVRQ